jgi:hypothetical protein
VRKLNSGIACQLACDRLQEQNSRRVHLIRRVNSAAVLPVEPQNRTATLDKAEPVRA